MDAEERKTVEQNAEDRNNNSKKKKAILRILIEALEFFGSAAVGYLFSSVNTYQAFDLMQGVEKTFLDAMEEQNWYIMVLLTAAIYIVVNIFATKISIILIENSENEIEKKTGEVISKYDDVISTIKAQHGVLLGFKQKEDEINEAKKAVNIKSLIGHLAEDYYGRCSDVKRDCASCPNFSRHCDGIFRDYLKMDCDNLHKLMKMTSENGKYELNTNIEEYHSKAIDHMVALKCSNYSVIQWIGGEETREALYDSLDYHFLNSLLKKLTTDKDEKSNTIMPYYKQKLSGDVTFKIKWLFVGDKTYMQNNFDYIFFAIDNAKLTEIANEFFEFYSIDENNYGLARDGKSHLNDYLLSKPSVGIFGDKFVFVDAPSDQKKRGDMWVNISENKNIAQKLHAFFENDLAAKRLLNFGDLLKEYEELVYIDNNGILEKTDWYDTLLKRSKNSEGKLTA
jgi:hypothetical protein